MAFNFAPSSNNKSEENGPRNVILKVLLTIWRFTWKIITRTIIFILIVVFGTYGALWAWDAAITPAPTDSKIYGVTFSKLYTEQLGLSWQIAYRDILDELGVRKIRIPAYWPEIEPRDDVFTFGDLDIQLGEAHRRDASVILAVGMRLPRWPECHIPDWANILSAEEQKEKLLDYMEAVITRYSRHPAIEYIQIENEPFLENFGICPPVNVELIDAEIALAKRLTNKPLLLTDGGEFGDWVRARNRGDIFGTTMYRVVFSERFGYFTYPLPPTYFTLKDWITRVIGKNTTTVVIELQGEAWGPKPIPYLPLDEQFRAFDFDDFRDTLTYVRKTNFPEVYLWGVEWWYWMKETQDDDRFWNEVKPLFAEPEK